MEAKLTLYGVYDRLAVPVCTLQATYRDDKTFQFEAMPASQQVYRLFAAYELWYVTIEPQLLTPFFNRPFVGGWISRMMTWERRLLIELNPLRCADEPFPYNKSSTVDLSDLEGLNTYRYTLVDKQATLVPIAPWSKLAHMDPEHGRVADTRVGEVRVSTVLLPVPKPTDRGLGPAFETMVFDGPPSVTSCRTCCDYASAVQQHEDTVQQVKNELG